MTFGQTLRELREKHNLRQRELSYVLGLSISTLSMYESGKRSPDLDTFCRIADYFDVSLDYLAGHIGRWDFEVLINSRFTDDTTMLQFLNIITGLSPSSKKLLVRYTLLLSLAQKLNRKGNDLSR